MTEDLPGKTVDQSRVSLGVLIGPADTNTHGNAHGGYLMKLMDEAGASAAMRHAQRPVVTVAVDQVLFREPINVGDLVTVKAELTYVGRTSLETRIEVMAQNLLTGQATHTNTAYFVYVALDDQGRPTPVAPLHLTTPAEEQQWQAARERQAYRLTQKQKLAQPG